MTLKSPYPWFGGKASIALLVWSRFGKVRNFVDPFFGSGAMLLSRPRPFQGTETVNDVDGMVANFWRAIQADPVAVASHADWPVNENDLHARHSWLIGQKESIVSLLEGDPEYFDPKIAGWWVWGCCCWIGSGWCSGKGPWQTIVADDGSRQLVHLGNAGQGVNRQRVHLGDAGRGVNRKRVHLGNAGQGVNRQRVHLGNAGQGVNRQRVHLGDAGQGDVEGMLAEVSTASAGDLFDYFDQIASRLRGVRVCCGDWSRVCGPTPTVKQGLTAVFLDPPYSGESGRTGDLYSSECLKVAHDVRDWCLDRGRDKRLRIALCGYEGEHEALEAKGWTVEAWKARGGYSSQAEASNGNASRERIWFSPHCINATLPLFAHMEDT